MTRAEERQLAERVRSACLQAARRAYADAAISGLCEEGALEAALGGIEMLDIDTLLNTEEPRNG